MGAGDVRVRVRAVSLNYRDLMVARGSKKRAKRIVPASDGAGEVIEIGSGVQRLAIGIASRRRSFQPGSMAPLQKSTMPMPWADRSTACSRKKWSFPSGRG